MLFPQTTKAAKMLNYHMISSVGFLWSHIVKGEIIKITPLEGNSVLLNSESANISSCQPAKLPQCMNQCLTSSLSKMQVLHLYRNKMTPWCRENLNAIINHIIIPVVKNVNKRHFVFIPFIQKLQCVTKRAKWGRNQYFGI